MEAERRRGDGGTTVGGQLRRRRHLQQRRGRIADDQAPSSFPQAAVRRLSGRPWGQHHSRRWDRSPGRSRSSRRAKGAASRAKSALKPPAATRWCRAFRERGLSRLPAGHERSHRIRRDGAIGSAATKTFTVDEHRRHRRSDHEVEAAKRRRLRSDHVAGRGDDDSPGRNTDRGSRLHADCAGSSGRSLADQQHRNERLARSPVQRRRHHRTECRNHRRVVGRKDRRDFERDGGSEWRGREQLSL